jgi:hypothetical protein
MTAPAIEPAPNVIPRNPSTVKNYARRGNGEVHQRSDGITVPILGLLACRQAEPLRPASALGLRWWAEDATGLSSPRNRPVVLSKVKRSDAPRASYRRSMRLQARRYLRVLKVSNPPDLPAAEAALLVFVNVGPAATGGALLELAQLGADRIDEGATERSPHTWCRQTPAQPAATTTASRRRSSFRCSNPAHRGRPVVGRRTAADPA